MRLRTLVLALALSSGMAMAASKHHKPPKVSKHAQPPKGPKSPKNKGSAFRPAKYKTQKQKAAKYPSVKKAPKHASRKTSKHKG